MRVTSYFAHCKFEAWLLLIAACLLDRHVERSRVVSRIDNDLLFEVVFELRQIAARVSSGYSRNK